MLFPNEKPKCFHQNIEKQNGTSKEICFLLVRILCPVWVGFLSILCDSKPVFFSKYLTKNQTPFFTALPLLQMEGDFVDIILTTCKFGISVKINDHILSSGAPPGLAFSNELIWFAPERWSTAWGTVSEIPSEFANCQADEEGCL